MTKAANRRFANKSSLNFLKILGWPFFQIFLFTVTATSFVVIKTLHFGPVLITSIILFSIIFYFQILKDLPTPFDLIDRPQKLTSKILDRNGELLYKIYQDENRTPIKLISLPLFVREAFLAIEDRDFYKHSGISITGIIRATLHNTSCKLRAANCELMGGSTITQQLVKNALLNREKTWKRKIKELILAIETEAVFEKDEIFEMYLNEVGFGGPAYGIQEASQQYFGKNANKLTLAEAAFIAGLPKAPSIYSPYINQEISLKRQRLVLANMLKNGFLNKNQYDEALNIPLIFNPQRTEIKAPHFVMYVRDLLVNQFGPDLVNHGGLIVTTSLDLKIQNEAEFAVKSELSKIKDANVGNGAALITRPGSGEILAMVGSKDYFDIKNDGQVNLTTALRQPGSAVKPINYALALENGANPDTLIKDGPISFYIQGSGVWTPKNYDGRFHGTITLRQALANSYNIPAIILLSKNGVENMIKLGQKMGISTWNNSGRYGLALTLGSAEIKMTDMAVVYGTLANSGITVPLNPILNITDSNGQIIKYPAPPPHYSIKPETASTISEILSDNQARAPAFGFNSILNLKDYVASVKTGTSNDLRDNWTFGFTPDFVVASWVGNNDNSPMSNVVSGVTGASPIWARIMKNLLGQSQTTKTHTLSAFLN